MELAILFSVAFGSALIVGYIGVAAEKGAREVARSGLGQAIGRWIFLYPVIDAAVSATSWVAERLRGTGGVAMEITEQLPGLLATLLRTIGILAIAVVVLWLGIMLLGFVLADYLLEFLVFAALLIAGIYWFRK